MLSFRSTAMQAFSFVRLGRCLAHFTETSFNPFFSLSNRLGHPGILQLWQPCFYSLLVRLIISRTEPIYRLVFKSILDNSIQHLHWVNVGQPNYILYCVKVFIYISLWRLFLGQIHLENLEIGKPSRAELPRIFTSWRHRDQLSGGKGLPRAGGKEALCFLF